MARPMVTTTSAEDDFRVFIQNQAFPCVGAKAALVRDALETQTYRDLSDNSDDSALWLAISDFGRRLKPGCAVVQSFAAIFPDTADMTELGFEHALWSRLSGLRYVDAQMGEAWSESTSADPDSHSFSLSIGGESFFVIGLHPNASRPARRFDCAALVFNSNAQFEALRADGRYQRMQRIIRERDRQLAGTINPMLKDFGEGSEAAQYSGRKVGPDWACPFSPTATVDLPLRPAAPEVVE